MEKLLADLVARATEVSAGAGGAQISIIGWSLGGIYSREIAKQCPDLVRQVITLGTPFKSIGEGTNAARVYEMLSKDTSHRNPEILRKLGERPPVPFTSLYSKSDGVVHWECSIEEESDTSQNIEIPAASHLGLGHNPIAMYVIANRLTQTRSNWTPFKTN
jgi:pimeloyl-ACP methyl ester carboxylesterase